jgi:hypothetical protein
MNRQPTPLHGLVTALVVSVLSFGFVCLALGSMFSNVDSRLMLTVTDTFSGLKEIRDVLNSTASYLSIFNPPGVDHVPFPAGPETLEELEDLVRRGLMPGDALGRFQAVDPASDPSLLHRLMVASWCSSGRAIPNVLPAARTPGCQCIADAYLDLVGTTRSAQNYSISGYAQVGGYNTTVLVGGANQTVLVNGTNRTVLVGAVNTTVWLNWTNQTLWVPAVVLVPVDVRMRVADRVYRCWDQRQVRRSRQCGDSCKVHLLGLPLFANIVLFLVCMSYLMFMQLGRSGWELYVIKLMVVGLGIALSIPFFVRYIEANVLNLAGVVVCLFYLVVSLHSELDAQSSSDKQYPSLTVSFLVNLPLVLSAHAVQLGVSGYGRDIWASLSFGACGGLLGVLLQVSFCLVLFFCFIACFLTSCLAAVRLGVQLLGHHGHYLPRPERRGPHRTISGLRLRAGFPSPRGVLWLFCSNIIFCADPVPPALRGVPERRQPVRRIVVGPAGLLPDIHVVPGVSVPARRQRQGKARHGPGQIHVRAEHRHLRDGPGQRVLGRRRRRGRDQPLGKLVARGRAKKKNKSINSASKIHTCNKSLAWLLLPKSSTSTSRPS